MIEVGRLCLKLAGRDAGNYCIIVDIINKNDVLIDGNVRRRKCNAKHLEPLEQVLPIKKGASTKDVQAAMKKTKIKIKEKKRKREKKKEKKPKPTKKRKSKTKK